MLFCEICPLTYKISREKEIIKRHLKNLLDKSTFASMHREELLPHVVYRHQNELIKRGPGIDLTLQENKAVNIRIACSRIDGLIVRPGEKFSFWKYVGNPSKKNGFKDGRTLQNGKLVPSMGGGLCNLANTIHLLILHSPLRVDEFHSHSDALAPDKGQRIPFSAGTSVNYNNLDYRFENDSDRPVQLHVWTDADNLYAELRTDLPFPNSYDLVEEDHHFHKEGANYYRISRIYKRTFGADGQVLAKELVLDNHSKVMFDHSLIPEELIR